MFLTIIFIKLKKLCLVIYFKFLFSKINQNKFLKNLRLLDQKIKVKIAFFFIPKIK